MSRNSLMTLALLVSIGVNLFLVGGISYRITNLPARDMRPLPPGVGWLVRDLSESRRAELSPLLEASEREISSVRAAMFEAQRRVGELMQSVDVDETTLLAAFRELRELNLRYQALSHEQTVAVLAQLTEAERLTATELLNRPPPRERRDGQRPPDGGPAFNPGGRPPPPPPPRDNL